MKDLSGQTIGNYRIEAPLGSGGMGAVYRAHHLHLERVVAIKVLHDHIAIDPSFQARFRQEANTLVALRHANIIDVIDFGEEAGRFYLVMELITDGSVRTLLQRYAQTRQILPLLLGLDLIRQATDALAFAHTRGIVHRDLKPDNLLLARGSTADSYILKISDFGLARLVQTEGMTATGVTMGTPAYMSPEQCQGIDLDGRSDLYSLGIVLYELATGYLPFETKNLSDAVYKHVYTPPPSPRDVRPDLPQALVDLIGRCLAKDPQQRFASASDFAVALQRISGGSVWAGSSVPLSPQLPVQNLTPLPATPTTIEQPPKANVVPPPVPSLVTPSTVPRVQVLDQQGQVLQVVELTGDGVSVGRLPDNKIVLDADAISRNHVRIDWDGNRVTVTDLGSRNGAVLDNTRLTPQVAHSWSPRGMLSVGPFWLRLEHGASAPTPQTLQSPRSSIGRIGVKLERDTLSLTPGQPTALRVTLANLGHTVDHLTVTVEGVPEQWVQGPAHAVQLNPGGQTTVVCTVQAPRSPESRAGEYPVVVRAHSRENPSEAGAAPARWTVLPFTGSTLALTPSRASGQQGATYRVTLRNEGNTVARYKLSGKDEEQALTFRFSQEQIPLDPGETSEVPLTLEAPRRWIGNALIRGFQVSAAVSADARTVGETRETPQIAPGQFVHRALIPLWVPPALLALLMLGLFLYNFLRPLETQLTEIHEIVSPGQEVILPGNNLGPQGQLLLKGESLPTSKWSSQEIRFLVPADAQQNEPLDIRVITKDAKELPGGDITVQLKPEVVPGNFAVKPRETVVLRGKALGTTKGEVYLNSELITPSVWQPEQISFRVPQAVDVGVPLPIEIRMPDGVTKLEGGTLTIKEEQKPVMSQPASQTPEIKPPPPQPELTPIEETFNPGDEVQLSGKYLGPKGKVFLDDKPVSPVVRWTADEVRFKVPPDARVDAELPIKVVTVGRVSLDGGHVTVRIRPTISPAERDRYRVGETVDLLGRGLGSNGKVFLGERPAAKFDWSPERVRISLTTDIRTGVPLPIKIELADGMTSLDAGAITIEERAEAFLPKKVRYKLGEEIELLGKALGNGGKLLLGAKQKQIAWDVWEPERIRFRIPNDVPFGRALPLTVIVESADDTPLEVGSITVQEEASVKRVRGKYRTGERIELSGSGLGEEGRVYLDGQEVRRADWGPDGIRFRIPDSVAIDESLGIEIETVDGQRLDAGAIIVERADRPNRRVRPSGEPGDEPRAVPVTPGSGGRLPEGVQQGVPASPGGLTAPPGSGGRLPEGVQQGVPATPGGVPTVVVPPGGLTAPPGSGGRLPEGVQPAAPANR